MGSKRHTESQGHAIAALAGQQCGVVARRQLRALGLTDRAITARVASGSLHPLFRGTFAVGHRAIGRQGRMFAAVLACGNGTLLSHGSAAELLHLWDRRPVPVDVIAPGQAGRKIQDIRRHNVLRPGPTEVTACDGIPCTTVSRTLVDMAARTGQRDLRRLVEQAAVLRVLDVSEIYRVLARGPRRGSPRLRQILAPWRSVGTAPPRLRSLFEARLLSSLAEAGLPAPEFNVKMRIGGHRFEVDALWKTEMLVVETDGEETHGTRAAFRKDRWRDQVLVGAGYRTARIAWSQIEDEPEATLARIRGMLAST